MAVNSQNINLTSIEDMEAGLAQAQPNPTPPPVQTTQVVGPATPAPASQSTQPSLVNYDKKGIGLASQSLTSSNIPLANTGEPSTDSSATRVKEELEQSVTEAKELVEENMPFVRKWLGKAVGIALMIQSIYGIYSSIIFILVEYPRLEQLLVSHNISQQEVDELSIRAVMIVFSTVLAMIFAMRLSAVKSKLMHDINVVVGILVFFGNALIHDYFATLNSSEFIVNWVTAFIDRVGGAPERVIEEAPFVQDALEGKIEPVWYK